MEEGWEYKKQKKRKKQFCKGKYDHVLILASLE
jgi:hypothetical protein